MHGKRHRPAGAGALDLLKARPTDFAADDHVEIEDRQFDRLDAQRLYQVELRGEVRQIVLSLARRQSRSRDTVFEHENSFPVWSAPRAAE
jgi:hypothetical protein